MLTNNKTMTVERKLIYGYNINGTGFSGLLDLNTNLIFCVCEEESANEIISWYEYASQTSISDEEIGEQIFDEITDWIYNVEDQAGNKLNVIDASDLKEIIPSIVAKLKAINHKPLGEWISVEDNTKTIR